MSEVIVIDVEDRVWAAPESRGYVVNQLQAALRGHGYMLEITGIFDDVTREILSRLQARDGIEVSGVLDHATWRHLFPKAPDGAPLFLRVISLIACVEGLTAVSARLSWDGPRVGLIGCSARSGLLQPMLGLIPPEATARQLGERDAAALARVVSMRPSCFIAFWSWAAGGRPGPWARWRGIIERAVSSKEALLVQHRFALEFLWAPMQRILAIVPPMTERVQAFLFWAMIRLGRFDDRLAELLVADEVSGEALISAFGAALSCMSEGLAAETIAFDVSVARGMLSGSAPSSTGAPLTLSSFGLLDRIGAARGRSGGSGGADS